MCGKVIKKFGSVTSNLIRHITKVHGTNIEGPKQTLMTDHIEGPKKYPTTSMKKKALDNCCALFIAKDMRPINIVEGDGFKKFVATLDPKYQLPSRQTITKSIIPRLTEDTKKALSESLLQAKWVAITTDMWSSSTCTSFMSVTGHFLEDDELTSALLDCSSFHGRHTSANITARLLHVVSEFEITDKIVCAVSDNAANVKKAIVDANMNGIPCFAHTLNLCIKDSLAAMEAFEPLRKKIVELVGFLHRSNNGKEDFAAVQVRLNMKRKVLIQDVKTRWNSTFAMLDRFIEQKEAVALFQTTASGTDFSFTREEWKMAADVKGLLEPAYEATVELSGQKYVSGSKVIPIAKSLITWYAQAFRKYERIEVNGFNAKFADAISRNLNFHLGKAETMETLSLSTLTDPRYKKQAFKDSEPAGRAIGKLKASMVNMAPVVEAEVRPARRESGSSGLWEAFDNEVSHTSARPTTRLEDSVSAEVLKYLKMINIPRSANPLDWWNSVGKELYPLIYEVAKKYLIVPGTSVPSERVFSAAGNIISKKRSLLADDTASNLIFLRENLAKKKK
jgi:hypothetical protein